MKNYISHFKFKTLLCFSLIIFFLPLTGITQNDMMQPGEYLEYEVSFMSIKLGTIKMYIENPSNVGNLKCNKVKAIIKSNEGIPFVDLYATFESWIDPSVTYSHKFVSNTKVDEKTYEFKEANFDYTNNFYDVKTFREKKQINYKKVVSNKKYNDGSSLFYLARKLLKLGKTVKIPTIISDDTCMTTINFHGKKENIEVDAINYPVKCIFFDGRADWEGLYGLKGNFEGWFSDDNAAVPILAKMNVYVGKVNIKLVKWIRPGWVPPKG